jgi:hypothetical protein
VLLIRADGTEREVDGHLTLEALQHLVGGYVQHVQLPDGRHIFVDEDGKMKRKPLNAKATALFYPGWDHIVGDVLVLTEAEFARFSDRGLGR